MGIISVLRRAEVTEREHETGEVVQLHHARATLDELHSDCVQASNRVVQAETALIKCKQNLRDAQRRFALATRDDALRIGITIKMLEPLAMELESERRDRDHEIDD